MATHKPGYITASTIGPFLTGKGSTLLTGGETAAKIIAYERAELIIPELDNAFSGSKHTDWGNEYEEDALEAYEAAKMVEVYGSQDQVEHWKRKWSCTPDGLVGQDGLAEAKCPSTMKNHTANLLYNSFLKDYGDQAQFQMFLTGRQWVDLISFDPRQKEWAQLHVCRIERDEARISFIEARLKAAEDIIEIELIKIETRKQKALI